MNDHRKDIGVRSVLVLVVFIDMFAHKYSVSKSVKCTQLLRALSTLAHNTAASSTALTCKHSACLLTSLQTMDLETLYHLAAAATAIYADVNVLTTRNCVHTQQQFKGNIR
jgi:hypothetical protein